MAQLERLESLFRERLGEWLDDQRERYMLDEDLVDMLETAAGKVLDKLPELTSFTDEPLMGEVDELDEDAVRATFEAFAEIWDEVEWRDQTKAPDPALLQERLVEMVHFLDEEEPDEGNVEEYVHGLDRYLEACGYQYVV